MGQGLLTGGDEAWFNAAHVFWAKQNNLPDHGIFLRLPLSPRKCPPRRQRMMCPMIAALPMYDWPQHQPQTDRLWQLVAEAFATKTGAQPPAQLVRGGDLMAQWLAPDLLMSQTCGLPYVRHLRGRVDLVGGVDHGLADTPAGSYCSRVIVHQDCTAASLADLAGARVAFNSTASQSGAAALRHMIAPLRKMGRFFGAELATGAHAASINAVAEGRADVAAIDAVTWAMAQRYLPQTANLRVLLSTPPTAGLPLITARNGPAEALFWALDQALQGIGPEARNALMMQGVVARSDADYDVIAMRDAQCHADGLPDLV